MDRKKTKSNFDNSTVIYIVLGIALAFVINQGLSFALSTNMPIVAVESNSMVPTFYKGDILILQGTSASELSVGDIIVFSPESSRNTVPVVHRIIEINSDGTFQTKGDANQGQLFFEKHIEPTSIHGRSILIIPYLGWVKIGVTEYVIPNILWIILAVIVAYGVVRLSKHIKTQRTTYMKRKF